MITAMCCRCGKSFLRKPSHVNRTINKFCSRACRYSATPEELFWNRVDKHGPDECWEWVGRKSKGYGYFDKNWKSIRAHVFSYELHNKPVDPGMEVIHSCDNPGCVNPAHLRQGTHLENMRDMSEHGRASRRSGEQHPMAILTWEKVREIRRDYVPRYGSIAGLGRKHGVNPATIWHIVHNKNWKEVQS
jgi:hypothetical protein